MNLMVESLLCRIIFPGGGTLGIKNDEITGSELPVGPLFKINGIFNKVIRSFQARIVWQLLTSVPIYSDIIRILNANFFKVGIG